MSVQPSCSNIYHEIDYKWQHHQVQVEFSSSSLNLWPRQLQHRPRGPGLCFHTIPNVLRAVWGSPSLSQKNFTSSLTTTAICSPPPHAPHCFLSISVDVNIIWGHLHSPSWDPSLTPARSLPVFVGLASWNPFTGPLIKLFLSWGAWVA